MRRASLNVDVGGQKTITVELDARKCFPNMPDEVFDQWIKPEVEFHGWHFVNLETAITHLAWAKHFRGRTLQYWSYVNWHRTSLPFKEVKIETTAVSIAEYLVDRYWHHIQPSTKPTATVNNSEERLLAAASFIRDQRQFPKSLVCFVNGNEWLLLAGHHRLAAMFTLKDHENFPFDTWLGTHALEPVAQPRSGV